MAVKKSNAYLDTKFFPKIVSQIRFNIENYITKRIEKAGVKGLVTSHGNILVQLYKEDKQTMAKIANDIGRCKSTLTVLVDKLVKVGFITREVDTNDTRLKKLCLTEKGKNFQKEFWQISSDLNERIWHNFSDTEKEQCMLYLNRIAENINSSLEKNNCNEK